MLVKVEIIKNADHILLIKNKETIALCKASDVLNPVQMRFLKKGHKEFKVNFKYIINSRK